MTSTLHIRCGDDLRITLPEAGMEGDYLRLADPVAQGPCPAMEDEAAFRDVRAAFLAESYGHPLEEVKNELEQEVHGMERIPFYDQAILWFEHDLYDQSILMRFLAWAADRPDCWPMLRLIAIGEFPGLNQRFYGLGQLSPQQIATLKGRDVPVNRQMMELARLAWAAYCDADPMAVWQLATTGTPDLPLLAPALVRHAQEFPWSDTGLSLTERLILMAAREGADSYKALFIACNALDPQPFYGDAMFWPIVDRLVQADRPGLEITGGEEGPVHDRQIAITETGRSILAGEADWADINGLERWVGGVQLAGHFSDWVWDREAQALRENG